MLILEKDFLAKTRTRQDAWSETLEKESAVVIEPQRSCDGWIVC